MGLSKTFINIYEDEKGKFISNLEYDSYESAFDNRDDLTTYIETVEIIRKS